MNSIYLKDGNITFEPDHLSIEDKARRNHIVSSLLIVFPPIYGITSILSYKNTGDEFILYSGILICILAGIALILWMVAIIFKKGTFYRMHYNNSISYSHIDYVDIKRPVVALMVDIILKNRKRRRIWLKDEKENVAAFQEFLKRQQVSVKVEPFTF